MPNDRKSSSVSKITERLTAAKTSLPTNNSPKLKKLSHRVNAVIEGIEVIKGEVSKTSAHPTYKKATLERNGSKFAIVAKDNKDKGEAGIEASLLEVGFSAVTRLFMGAKYTPRQEVMMNKDGQVTGTISHNFSNYIESLVSEKNQTIYSLIDEEGKLLRYLDPENKHPEKNIRPLDPRATNYRDQIKKGYVFLDHGKPPIYFDRIMKMQAAYKDSFVIDMDSLACIFTASYAFEEDDLHKGNMGYYVTDLTDKEGNVIKNKERNSIKKISFFKIDHDLMFIDSIMSHKQAARISHTSRTERAFDMTVADMLRFPDIKDSGNHYWPTRRGIAVKGLKAYTRKAEREAFANLKNNEWFKHSKWIHFLKYSVMPRELIQTTLMHHLDPEKDSAHISLITTALNARIAKFKRTLFEVNEFKELLINMTPEERQKIKDSIKAEILQAMRDIKPGDKELEAKTTDIAQQVDNAFDAMFTAAKADSPLYRDLLLDSYQFGGKYTLQAAEKSLLSEQLKEAHSLISKATSTLQDKIKAFKYACIATDLSFENDKANEIKNAFLMPEKIQTTDAFISKVREIRECNLPLKQQKKEVLALLNAAALTDNALQELRRNITQPQPAADLQFLRQQRSSLWIVRKFRGLYGNTATVDHMIMLIDKKRSLQLNERLSIHAKKLTTEGSNKDLKEEGPQSRGP